MSRDELISEIVRRVMQKIAEYEKNSCPSSNAVNNATSPSNVPSSGSCCCCSGGSSAAGSSMQIDKRLLSERDVIDAVKNGVAEIHYSKRTIVTDLAKDYANRHKVKLVKD